MYAVEIFVQGFPLASKNSIQPTPLTCTWSGKRGYVEDVPAIEGSQARVRVKAKTGESEGKDSG